MEPRNHRWGVSAGADCVWSQVSGMAPSKAGTRPLMVFQAFIDDSADEQIYALGGHIASVEQWAKLSEAWEKLLPQFGVLAKDGSYHFKMAEMALNDERMDRIGPFFRLIEDHVAVSLSCWLRPSDIMKANDRFQVEGQSFGLPKEVRPFKVAFRALLNTLAANISLIEQSLPIDLPIDFFFDEQSEKGAILSGWDRYVERGDPGLRKLIGSAPKFENDKRFVALQAADFQAWWVRKWRGDGNPEWDNVANLGGYRPRKERLGIDVHVSERDIADVLRSSYMRRIPAGGRLWEKVPITEGSMVLNFSVKPT